MHLNNEDKAKLIDGKLSAKEREKFLKHMAECKECFEAITDSVLLMDKIKKEPVQKRFLMVITKRKRYITLLAASLLIAIIPFFWKVIKTSMSGDKISQIMEIFVEKGKKKSLVLADGTKLILDAGSVFKYPQKFNKNDRTVFLNGEAFFEVQPDKEKPFIVNANHATIKVLGTKFNVRAWHESNQVGVAVSEGKVSFFPQNVNQKKSVLISGGEYSKIPKNGVPTEPIQVDVNKYVGWIERSISCDNTPLREILNQLERWYDIHFDVDEKIRVSDLITIHATNKSIEEIIELIAYTWGLKYRYEDQKVYLYLNNNKKSENESN